MFASRIPVRKVTVIVGLWLTTIALHAASFDPTKPATLYLNWQHDPATTMTVNWLSPEAAPVTLQFRGIGAAQWYSVVTTSQPLPGTNWFIQRVELTRLAPGKDYEFCFERGAAVFRLRTMPKDLSSPVRFVAGGDVYSDRTRMDSMNAQAAKLDPAFIVLGGDLAYSMATGVAQERVERWFAYFESWMENSVAPEGRLIPMVVAIGNHEVQGNWRQTPQQSAGFNALFAMPGAQGYGVLDFGDYLSLFLLDSGHTHPIPGEQTAWLRSSLSHRRNRPHLIPVYHIPGWPSFRPFEGGENGPETEAIREYWCPLFDRYGVQLAFENHDHTFKRTHPLRAGKRNPRGTVYLGDGCWSVVPRLPEASGPRWYLERSEPVRHFYLVTLFPEARHVIAMNFKGELFDELYQRVR